MPAPCAVRIPALAARSAIFCMSTYSDQLEAKAPTPSPRCELSQLITAATKPNEIPVAHPSAAARRDRDVPGW